MTAPIKAPPSPAGTLARLRLTEPVLLYLLPPAVLAILGSLICAGAGEWAGAFMLAVSGLLTGAGAAAARVSVYSPRSMVQTVLRSRQ